MASVNTKSKLSTMKEKCLSPVDMLKRTCMCCLLWEDTFYEDGVSVTDRIKTNMAKVSREEAVEVLHEAKDVNKLRHLPLFLLICMAENHMLRKEDVCSTITRVDDMSELLALYWKDGKKPLPAQMVKGLKMAFSKFDEYQLAKYKGDSKEIKLRDVLRIVRPKPENEEQSALWKRAVSGTFATPDTWEVELSKSKDKKSSWTRLLSENRLGSLALLRNIRNMKAAGVETSLVRNAIAKANVSRILPFQILASARMNPDYEDALEPKLFESIKEFDRIPGNTLILVDTSVSMGDRLSEKSDMNRCDAASAVAAIFREVCENVAVYKFDGNAHSVPPRRGFALTDMFKPGGCTNVYGSVKEAVTEEKSKGFEPARIVVFTDEQDNYYDMNNIAVFAPHGYIVNVGTYEKGVLYQTASKWVHISGWSDGVVKFITENEKKN
jgi:hypothetical protein